MRSEQETESAPPTLVLPAASAPRRRCWPWQAVFILATFVVGTAAGYLLRGIGRGASDPADAAALAEQVNPPQGYALPAIFGDVGPRLLAAGAINLAQFGQVYAQAGQPLTEEQLAILTEGSAAPAVIDRENAYFLLNFFWALGLANENPLLTDGPMMRYGDGEIGRFASTGGWTIGAKPVTELYAGAPIIPLTPAQQARLEEVAYAVYRPCCNNPTAFPDCNHGMALLGLLELMASQDATVDEMFAAAKYANAFWFPQQALETAIFFEAKYGQRYAEVDPRQAVGRETFSASGFNTVHRWLVENELLEQAPGAGGSCGV